MEGKNFILKSILYTLLIVMLVILSFGMIRKGFLGDEIIVNVNLEESKNVDYKVYLKENDYFDGKFLSKDNVLDNMYFITSLIDYIDLDFTYDLNFDKDVSGAGKYSIKAIVEANRSNDDTGKYWSKEYALTDLKTINFENNSIKIKENVSVDYDKYNSLLTGFKKQYNLSADGILKIVLDIDSFAINEDLTDDIKRKSEVVFQIPLSQLAVQANIDSSDSKVITDTISQISKSKDIEFLIYKVLGLISTACIILLILGFAKIIRKHVKYNYYRITKKKILSTYGDIIVNVNNKFDLTSYKVAFVKEFSELLDAHNEVRLPINFYENRSEKYCLFYLINDKFVWAYKLQDNDVN